jgi:hypothetical protein
MDLGLKGKIALLTGASRGLGFATAKFWHRKASHCPQQPGSGKAGGGREGVGRLWCGSAAFPR